MSVAPARIISSRMTSAPAIPQKRTRCWRGRGTAKAGRGGGGGPARHVGGSWWPVGRVSDRRASGTTGRRARRIALSAVGQPGVIVVLPASGKQGQDVADIDVVSCLYEARETLAAAVRPPARRPPPP